MSSQMTNPLKSKIFHIDSQDFEKSNDSIQIRLDNPIFRVKKFRLIGYSFPYSFYNITTANNTFKIQYNNGAVTTFNLEPGNYSTLTLADSFKAKLLALFSGSSFNVAFSKNSGKFYMSAANTFKIIYSGNTLGQKIMNLVADVTSINKSVTPRQYDIMATSDSSSNSWYIDFSSLSSIMRTTELQIRTNLTYSISTSSQSDNLLLSIPIDKYLFGDVITSQTFPNLSDIEFTPNRDTIEDFSIQITDIDKKAIEFNNVPFSLSIQFFYSEY
jgi:hypothetical protein